MAGKLNDESIPTSENVLYISPNHTQVCKIEKYSFILVVFLPCFSGINKKQIKSYYQEFQVEIIHVFTIFHLGFFPNHLKKKLLGFSHHEADIPSYSDLGKAPHNSR